MTPTQGCLLFCGDGLILKGRRVVGISSEVLQNIRAGSGKCASFRQTCLVMFGENSVTFTPMIPLVYQSKPIPGIQQASESCAMSAMAPTFYEKKSPIARMAWHFPLTIIVHY